MTTPKHNPESGSAPDGPPCWIDRLLAGLIAPRWQEDLLGDLHEIYRKKVDEVGPQRARHFYYWQVLTYLRLAFLHRKVTQWQIDASTHPFFLHPVMIRNYTKVAIRNLAKNKAFSLINIVGLALGMICCLFIFLWIQDEKSVDNFHAKGPSLYAAYQTVSSSKVVNGLYGTPMRPVKQGDVFVSYFPLEDAPRSIPEIQHVVFYATGYERPWGHAETFQVGEKKIKLEGSRASRDFFKLFSYPLLAGRPETALQDINGIAISRKMADLFFKSPQDAIGKLMRFENRLTVRVAAVFENVPTNSSLKFDFLFNWEAQKKNLNWASNYNQTYLQLAPGADVAQVTMKINRLMRVRLANDKDFRTEIGLQPLGEQYLHSTFVQGKPQGGRIEYVRIFTGVALFILLIACINFMILATARSRNRAKEVGVRKVLGSTRSHLAGQFFGEALLLAALATIVTLLAVVALLPAFNAFTGKHMTLPVASAWFWTALLGLMLLTGLLAGSYPALFLSSLEPVRVLKGVLRFSRSSVWFRQGLTVVQFSLSIMLVVATLVISRQINFVQHTHLGYDRDQLLYVDLEGELTNPRTYRLFKDLVSEQPGIDQVDRSTEAPHAMGFVVDEKDGALEASAGEDAINWEGKEKNASVGFKPLSVGYDFVRMMKLKLVQGRDFSRSIATDSADAFLVNEEAVRQMGLKQPLGKWVSAWQKKGHIIGVLKDYHTNSLHEPIKPLIMDVKEYENFGVMLVRLKAGRTREALTALEQVYKQLNPNYPFAYQFLDQEYANLYRSEQVMAKLTQVFAGLAMAISCLGLLGLVIFSAEQRRKEIGIRKVLGASVLGILALLSRDFVRLVLLALLLATPLAWYAMHEWLKDFAYRVSIDWWIFALAGGLAMGIALLTVSYQSLKAALMNPVKSLRSE